MPPESRPAYLKAQERTLIDEICGIEGLLDVGPEAFIAGACDLFARLARVQEVIREEELSELHARERQDCRWAVLDRDGDMAALGATEGQLWINAAGLRGRSFKGAELLEFRRRMEAKGYRAEQAKAI